MLQHLPNEIRVCVYACTYAYMHVYVTHNASPTRYAYTSYLPNEICVRAQKALYAINPDDSVHGDMCLAPSLGTMHACEYVCMCLAPSRLLVSAPPTPH